MSNNESKNCPHCHEEIKAIAIKCRYCKSMLVEDQNLSTVEFYETKEIKSSVEIGENLTARKTQNNKLKNNIGWYILASIFFIGLIYGLLNLSDGKTSSGKNEIIASDNREVVDTVINNDTLKEEILYYTNGTYTGQVKNGNPHGIGTFLFNNCKEYVGEWENGMMHGQGMMRFPSPSCEERYYNHTVIAKLIPETYYGEWVENKKHGHGIKYWVDGTIYTGYFAENDLIRGQIITPDGFIKYRDGLQHTNIVPDWWDGYTAEVPEWWYENPDSTTYAGLQKDVFESAMNRTGNSDATNQGSTNYSHFVDKYVVVNVDVLRLRGGPGENYNIIGRLEKGTVLQVIANEGDWLVVIAEDLGGFVHGDYVVEK